MGAASTSASSVPFMGTLLRRTSQFWRPRVFRLHPLGTPSASAETRLPEVAPRRPAQFPANPLLAAQPRTSSPQFPPMDCFPRQGSTSTSKPGRTPFACPRSMPGTSASSMRLLLLYRSPQPTWGTREHTLSVPEMETTPSRMNLDLFCRRSTASSEHHSTGIRALQSYPALRERHMGLGPMAARRTRNTCNATTVVSSRLASRPATLPLPSPP